MFYVDIQANVRKSVWLKYSSFPWFRFWFREPLFFNKAEYMGWSCLNHNILAWSCFWGSIKKIMNRLIEHKCPSHEIDSVKLDVLKRRNSNNNTYPCLERWVAFEIFHFTLSFLWCGASSADEGDVKCRFNRYRAQQFFGAKTSTSNLIVSQASIKICALTFWHLGTFSQHQWWQTDSFARFFSLLPGRLTVNW